MTFWECGFYLIAYIGGLHSEGGWLAWLKCPLALLLWLYFSVSDWFRKYEFGGNYHFYFCWSVTLPTQHNFLVKAQGSYVVGWYITQEGQSFSIWNQHRRQCESWVILPEGCVSGRSNHNTQSSWPEWRTDPEISIWQKETNMSLPRVFLIISGEKSNLLLFRSYILIGYQSNRVRPCSHAPHHVHKLVMQ